MTEQGPPGKTVGFRPAWAIKMYRGGPSSRAHLLVTENRARCGQLAGVLAWAKHDARVIAESVDDYDSAIWCLDFNRAEATRFCKVCARDVAPTWEYRRLRMGASRESGLVRFGVFQVIHAPDSTPLMFIGPFTELHAENKHALPRARELIYGAREE